MDLSYCCRKINEDVGFHSNQTHLFNFYFSVVEDFCNLPEALNCSHICGIENGEPVCQCPIGYHLAPDKMTCVGRHFYIA